MSSHASALALHVLSTGRREDAARILIAIWLLLQHLLLRLAAACLGLVPPDSKGWDSNAGGDNANDPDTNLPLTPRPLHTARKHRQKNVAAGISKKGAAKKLTGHNRCFLIRATVQLQSRATA
jgi:hypothetical protein